jgi:hypothetical protein
MAWRASTVLAVLGIFLISPSAQAERPFIDSPEPITPKSVQSGRKWTEGDISLPAWPQERNLVEINTDDPDARFKHLLDVNSLVTGDDGVVRYTVVAESASGSRNVTFEGLRCTARGQYKVYAYGNDGRFLPTTVAEQWQPVDPRGIDAYRTELWRHYLCIPRLLKPRPKKDQVHMLRSGRVPAVENQGFLTN